MYGYVLLTDANCKGQKSCWLTTLHDFSFSFSFPFYVLHSSFNIFHHGRDIVVYFGHCKIFSISVPLFYVLFSSSSNTLFSPSLNFSFTEKKVDYLLFCLNHHAYKSSIPLFYNAGMNDQTI